jgi:uncharacterized phage protein (TIGR02220 family)
MKELPYFKFYVGEWIAGDIQKCSLEVQGVFVNLAALIWHNGGPVPMDPDGLARMLRTDKQCLSNALSVLERYKIIALNDDTISIKFLEEQQRDFIESHEKRVAAGRKGGSVRIVDRFKKVGFKQCLSNDQEEPEQSQAIKSNNKSNNKKKIIYIVEYLNKQAGTNYKTNSKPTISKIDARLNEGWTVQDFETVISSKVVEWLHNPEMKKFLRPETLFGNKFESYLQAAAPVKPEKKSYAL